MSELTVITTVEITDIHRNVPDSFRMNKEKWSEFLKEALKDLLKSDDVVVTKIQEFPTGEKVTMDKYVSIVEKMKETDDYTIDLKAYSNNDINLIHNLLTDEEMFVLYEKFRNVDAFLIRDAILSSLADED